MTNETQPWVITPEQQELTRHMERIFTPHATRQRAALLGSSLEGTHARFVHYTSAEAALNIIKTKRFWMRNTNCMSDYREVQLGYDLFKGFFSEPTNAKLFIEALDSCVPGVAHEAVAVFDQTWNDMRLNTYITCMSEHSESEDSHGRLSMWRALGGNVARVGMVFKVPSISQGSLALHLLFSPVAYLSETGISNVMNEVIANIQKEKEFLRTLDRTIIVGHIFLMLMAGVT